MACHALSLDMPVANSSNQMLKSGQTADAISRRHHCVLVFHCSYASEGTVTVLSDGVCACVCFSVCVVFVCALQLQGVLARLAS